LKFEIAIDLFLISDILLPIGKQPII